MHHPYSWYMTLYQRFLLNPAVCKEHLFCYYVNSSSYLSLLMNLRDSTCALVGTLQSWATTSQAKWPRMLVYLSGHITFLFCIHKCSSGLGFLPCSVMLNLLRGTSSLSSIISLSSLIQGYCIKANAGGSRTHSVVWMLFHVQNAQKCTLWDPKP